jgi:hypothetical protein
VVNGAEVPLVHVASWLRARREREQRRVTHR